MDVLPGLKAGASTPPDGSAVAPVGPRPFLPALNGGVPRAFLMVAEFATLRVVAVRETLPGPHVWLVLRRHIETGELKTSLCTAPVDTAVETQVRMSGMRWPIETCCEDRKPLLGMGDDAVRSWTGWHHHMTLVILAHFFVVRMRLRLKKSPRGDVAPRGAGVGSGLAPPRV